MEENETVEWKRGEDQLLMSAWASCGDELSVLQSLSMPMFAIALGTCLSKCRRFWNRKVPAVPESLLKRRKAFATMKAIRIKKMLAAKKVTWSECLPGGGLSGSAR